MPDDQDAGTMTADREAQVRQLIGSDPVAAVYDLLQIIQEQLLSMDAADDALRLAGGVLDALEEASLDLETVAMDLDTGSA